MKRLIALLFNNYKNLVFVLLLLIILTVTLIFAYSGQKTESTSDRPDNYSAGRNSSINIENAGNKVEVLPQNVRSNDEATVKDPFQKPFILSGLLVADNGGNIAIIQYTDEAYVVKEGDRIGNRWVVKKIEEAGVLLSDEKEEILVQFAE